MNVVEKPFGVVLLIGVSCVKWREFEFHLAISPEEA